MMTTAALTEAQNLTSSGLDDMILRHEIEEFLTYEAFLLDERRFREWNDLLTDDLEYWMPVRSARARGDEANEFAKLGEGAFFDETKELIEERIRKLETGFAWAEDPPSRTRHMTTNVRILDKSVPNEVKLTCNFLIYRGRLARDEDLWIGCRHDTLRRGGSGWKLAKRHIFLDQVSLLAKNLSIFF
jgi:3-phenylpropionate/cinnamic acid dioxygenase small subunit